MISNIAQLRTALNTAVTYQIMKAAGGSNTASVGTWTSHWRLLSRPEAGAIPPVGSGMVCDDTSVGALQIAPAQPGKTLRLSSLKFRTNVASGLFLVDRLVATSGLDTTITTPQTVNTVALPARAGNGEGVEIWLEWYVTSGATVSKVSVTYTNSEGVSGRVTEYQDIVASRRVNSMLRMPLQTGDTGVRSVESVTFTASTALAGNVGVTLAKRICSFPANAPQKDNEYGAVFTGLPAIHNNAAIMPITSAPLSTAAGINIELNLIEDDL